MDSDQSLSEWSDEEGPQKTRNDIEASSPERYSSSDSEEIYCRNAPPRNFHCYNLSEALQKPYVPIRSFNEPLVVTQEILIEELRWLLCGARTSELFLEINGDIKLHPGCECKELSHSILASYFEVYFTFVKDFRQLQDFVSSEGHWSRTHEALKLWLSRFNSDLLLFFTGLQSRTLLETRYKWTSKMNEMQPVFNCLRTLVQFGQPTITAFDTVTQILSTVYDSVDSLAFYAEPTVLDLMMDLMMSLLQPQINLIDIWLKTGYINDPFKEFFVIPVHSKKPAFTCLVPPCYFLENIYENLVKATKAKDVILQMTAETHQIAHNASSNESIYSELISYLFNDCQEDSVVPRPSESTERVKQFEFATNIPGERRQLMTEAYCRKRLKSTMKPLVLKEIAERFQAMVHNRCSVINRTLMSSLEDRFRLSETLTEISVVFSLFALDDLCSVVFEKIIENDVWYDQEMLSSHLQTCLTQAGFRKLDKRWSCSAVFQSNQLPTEGFKCLESLRFSLKLNWPINKIVTSHHLEKYNRVSLFLMKLQFSRFVLSTSRFPRNSRSAQVSRVDRRLLMLRFEMLSFLNAIFTSIIYQFWTTWDAETVLKSCDFDSAITAHDLLVSRICHVALQTENLTILHRPVWTVCKLTTKLRDLLCVNTHTTEAKVVKIQEDFIKCRSFLLTIIKMTMVGVPQLEGLYYQLVSEDDLHYHSPG